MIIRCFLFKSLVIIILLMTAVMPLFCKEADEPGTELYVQGFQDGKRDGHGNFFLYYFTGCTGVGLILPYVLSVNIPAENLAGKEPDYIEGYEAGYKKKVQDENRNYACWGAGTTGVVVIGLIVAGTAAHEVLQGCADSINPDCTLPSCDLSNPCNSCMENAAQDACSNSFSGCGSSSGSGCSSAFVYIP